MTSGEEYPFNRDAEEGVIGAILINPDMFPQLRAIVTAGDFYIHRLRFIWQAIEGVSDAGLKIDNITIADALNKAGHLDEIGGPALLTALLNTVPSSLHAESYALIIADCAVRRKLIMASSKIASAAFDASSSQAAIGIAVKSLNDVLTSASPDGGEITVRQAISDHYDKIHQPPPPVLPTSWVDMNLLLDGGFATGFHVFAGRPGTGKSALLLNLAAAACKKKQRGAFFSLEMPTDQNMDRLVSLVSGIPYSRIKTHALIDDDEPKYLAAVEEIGEFDLMMAYTPSLTPEKLMASCTRLSAKKPLDFVVVDYLQLMHAAGFRPNDNRVQEISYITRFIKQLSGELDAPVFVASQLNREVEHRASRRPQLSDLRESGSTEQDADSVTFLWTESDDNNKAEPLLLTASVAKARSGRTGDISLVFKGEIMSINGQARL